VTVLRRLAATLDYSSMFARLAYASKGVQPQTRDLYAIPGLEGHRAAVKLGVSALLFDQHARRQWPKTEQREQPLHDAILIRRLPLFGRWMRATVKRRA
jgi:hypothetical protein